MPGGERMTRLKLNVYSDDVLRDVAEIYRQARERGERAPTVAVAKYYGVTRSTAGRAIAAARAKGLLDMFSHPRQPKYTCPGCGWRCRGPHTDDGRKR